MTSQWLSEVGAVARYVVRSRILWFWILAMLIWPICYIWLLGAQGTSPIMLSLNLALIPVGPILFGIIGAQVTDMTQAKRAQEILKAWPMQPWLRTLSIITVLVVIALISALVTNGVTIVGVSGRFWQGHAWAIMALEDGLLVVGLTDLLWMAGGFVLGSWIHGLWKLLASILVPMGWLIGSLVVADTLMAHGTPYSQLVASLQVGPFSWLVGRVSVIWGYGPYQHLLGPFALLTAVVGMFLVAIAGLKGYGRDGNLVLGAGLLGLGVVWITVGVGGGLIRLGTVNHYQALASAYHSGKRSKVRLIQAQMIIRNLAVNQIDATTTFTVKPETSLSRVKFFLNPSLKVMSARVNGQLVPVSALSTLGWHALNAPVAKSSHDSVQISFEGNPYLSAPINGLAYAAAFVSRSGWLLPGGDWYPLLGTPGNAPIPWKLYLDHAPKMTTVTSIGTLRPAGHGALLAQGQANNVSMVGGHLAAVGYHGLKIYTGADELTVLRKMLAPKNSGVAPAGSSVTDLNRLVYQLKPDLKGNLIVPYGSGTPPYSRTVDPMIPQMWPQGVRLSYSSPGVAQALENSATSRDVSAVYNGFGRLVLDLWMTQGMSTIMPTGTVLDHVVSSVLLTVETNDQIKSAMLGHLPMKAFPGLLMRVRALHLAGHLTAKTVSAAVRAIVHQYP